MSLPEFQPDRADRVLVLTARSEEYRDGLEELESFAKKLHQNHPYYHRSNNRYQTRVLHLGVGPDQARRTLAKLDGVIQPDFLIVAGTAGSLSNDLSPGTFYLPTAVGNRGNSGWFYPEEDTLHWAYERLGMFDQEHPQSDTLTVRTGPLVTSPTPVLKHDQRKQLRDSYQALAVDMETYPVIEHFQSRSSSPGWVSVRVISDGPSTESRQQIEDRQESASRKLSKFLGFLIDHV